jgi:ATP:ADP antiporter, AAA family
MRYSTVGVSDRLYDLLNLRQGEGRIVTFLLLFSFFQYFAVALFFITASAIFLTGHNNIATSLPYVYIGSGLLLLLIGAIFNFLEDRLSEQKIILAEAIMLVVITLLLRLGFLSQEVSWLGFALIIWHRVMSDFVGDGFNRLALLLFDVRQSKRLFGLISAAEIPANILGYSTATALVPVLGTSNLLWVSAAGLAVAFVFLLFIVSGKRRLIPQESDEPDVQRVFNEDRDFLDKVFQSPFIFWLSITMFFSTIAFTFIEFAFLSRVDATYSKQQDIVLFIALIFGAGQIVAFFIKTFLYGRIQRRYGVKVSLFVLPFAIAAIAAASSFEGILTNSKILVFTWVGLMLVSEMLKSSVYNTTFLSLLQPLSKSVKLSGFSIMGTVESIAVFLSGGILIFFYSIENFDLLDFSILLLAVVVAWIFVIPRLNKNYLLMLEEVLKKRIIEGGVLPLNNPQTLAVVHEKLKSDHPGEVLYALDVLCKDRKYLQWEMLVELLTHPLMEVRREVYNKIELLRIQELQNYVRDRIDNEPSPELRKMAIHTYCAIGEATVVDEVIPFLDHDTREVQLGALVGLICFGGINGIIVAGQRLMEYVNSQDTELRKFSAQAIGEVGIRNFYHPLLVLLRDDQVEVEKEALRAAGKIRHPQLYQPMLKAVSSPNVFEVAMNALVKSGEEVIDLIEPELENGKNSSAHLRRLIYVCGKVGGDRAVNVLKTKLYYPNIEVRNQVLQSCSVAGFKPDIKDRDLLLKMIHQELADATYFLHCTEVLNQTDQLLRQSNLKLLIRALKIEVNYIKKRILFLLAFLYNSREILQLWNNLQLKNRQKAANALEILDVLASKEITAVVMPLLEDFSIGQQLKILSAKYPSKRLTVDEYLYRIISGKDSPVVLPWTQAVAAYLVNQIKVPTLKGALEIAENNSNILISETAAWTIRNLYNENPEVLPMVNHDSTQYTLPLIDQPTMSTKLLAIEKVMALKTTGLFRETAEDLLVDIAYILREVSYKTGDVIVEKNEVGHCMYIIYSGSVKVHDGQHQLAVLRSRDFFGELSLLDSEPRSASVTALEDSLLLRIDQHAFYEIMADRMEVIREIMKILCSRLRNQNHEVARLSGQLAMVEKAE